MNFWCHWSPWTYYQNRIASNKWLQTIWQFNKKYNCSQLRLLRFSLAEKRKYFQIELKIQLYFKGRERTHIPGIPVHIYVFPSFQATFTHSAFQQPCHSLSCWWGYDSEFLQWGILVFIPLWTFAFASEKSNATNQTYLWSLIQECQHSVLFFSVGFRSLGRILREFFSVPQNVTCMEMMCYYTGGIVILHCFCGCDHINCTKIARMI